MDAVRTTYDVDCLTSFIRSKEVECQTDPASTGMTDLIQKIRDKKGQDLSAVKLKELLDLKWPEEGEKGGASSLYI